jgi:predicted nuclease of restriction endonuclease-like (RecB) superfamily
MLHDSYKALLSDIKSRISEAQVRTVSAANSQMLLLYWQLGHLILNSQSDKGWGAKVIDQLSADLRKEFPSMKGFSNRNLLYMKQFAERYDNETISKLIYFEASIRELPIVSQVALTRLLLPDIEHDVIAQQAVAQLQVHDYQPDEISQQAVAQLREDLFLQSVLARISWSHHIVLMDKEPHLGKRFWYMLNSLEHGNSRNVLAMQIESGLFERQVAAKKLTNFERTLPPPQSDFANYLLKDPYIFDFVQAKEKADERSIEEQLANHVTKFLLELGQGFAFMGRQVHFEIGGSDFYADLLFYHTKLHCHVIVELKARPFEPGDASQLNFYVNVANDKLKTKHDNDTIGLLLCKGKNEVLAEYSLKGYSNAIGVSDYQISKAIPEELKSSLPQVEDIENELRGLNG